MATPVKPFNIATKADCGRIGSLIRVHSETLKRWHGTIVVAGSEHNYREHVLNYGPHDPGAECYIAKNSVLYFRVTPKEYAALRASHEQADGRIEGAQGEHADNVSSIRAVLTSEVEAILGGNRIVEST